jgi:exoribonuclease R
MKVLADPARALGAGLEAIRAQYRVPPAFPPAVVAAAEAAARRTPTEHVDRTNIRFVTLDPASSTDLDQAFAIERAGGDLLLRYAIADVAWFVGDGDPVDAEAWTRGETLYLPDGKAGLYPPVLAEGAASLLPAGPRPAIVFVVRVDAAGKAVLQGVERAIIRSGGKLAYDSVGPKDLPADFAELARRITAAEDARGASRVDPPEQEVSRGADGSYDLSFRPRLQSEDDNAALSLATNLAVADALLSHGTGLFRVMGAPSPRAVDRLRQTARALGIDWPADAPLEAFERTLSGSDPKQAALMIAIRRAGEGAIYVPYTPGQVPWHAAMSATYCHATAPLRRLADRYVIRAAYAIANGKPVPTAVTEAFAKLPAVMARADNQSGQVERAVVDLAEAVILQGREGETFGAIVTDADDRGARVQLRDLPVVTRVDITGATPGDKVELRLARVDPGQRTIKFERAS